MTVLVKVSDSISVSSHRDNDPVVVDLERWASDREQLLLTEWELGLRVAADTDIAALANNLSLCALIEIEFDAFTDGRGFSLAAQLRQLGFRGELRAVGTILVDQLYYLQRCGFDGFELPGGTNSELITEALQVFSHQYQTV